MRNLDLPANLSLMDLRSGIINLLQPVTTLDVLDGGTSNFHDEGLFSTTIFGRVGSEDRDLRFSYIDIHIEIFHPVIYNAITQLKNLYKGIITGKAYAIWDEKEKDFVASDILNGESGYHFFMQHWQDIVFKETAVKTIPEDQGGDVKPSISGGVKRNMKILLVELAKKRGLALTTKVLVIPAGLRDLEVGDDGRMRQGEINDKYRALLSASNTISTSSDFNTPILNVTRISLQNAFNDIYDYFKELLKGKNGLIQRKWGSRNIMNGTRNVITSMENTTPYLGALNSPKINSTVYGLYQTIKGTLPISQHLIMNGWLTNVFPQGSNKAQLVNPKTLHREEVNISADVTDKWTTSAGIEKVIHNYVELTRRLKPLMIKGYYIGLVYRGPDMTFKIFGDIDELPSHLSKDHVFPLTLTEFIYIAGYKVWNTIPNMVTRHPVTGIGSIYPSYTYVRTTVKAELRYELNDTWELDDEARANPALEYPTFGSDAHVDSQQVHPSRLGGLGGD